MSNISETQAAQQADEERRKNERTAQNVAYTAALRNAAPSWVKQNLGLRIKQEGLNKRDVEKAVVAFTRNTGRPPTVEEFDSSVPGFFDPKPDDGGSGFGGSRESSAVAASKSLDVYIASDKIKITPGLVIGEEPTYFGGTPPTAATGYVYAQVTVTTPTTGAGDITNAAVTSRSIIFSETELEDTGTTFNYKIASITQPDATLVITQYAYGPVDGLVFRNWYSNPPTARVAFMGS